MLHLTNTLRARPSTEEGATAVEYAIMVALIAAVIIVAVVVLGKNASSTFDCVSDAIPAGTGADPCN
ncbi:Flp family type IVb pilin [Salsipaludibacter albus]|uniref:Flp family type IVb pilin n=1 Tax=Salsipaludibacter albus TaxID=2849650 RepID=UPI001EE450FC|nr:Flp family type IVb pilin [Salsipaludibacter albus]MBY5162895.1 Flp family type IVb pilin [Salsipaludibacter albus]